MLKKFREWQQDFLMRFTNVLFTIYVVNVIIRGGILDKLCEDLFKRLNF